MTTLPEAVLLDLLPVYMTGEASAETVALVEAFLESNPQFADSVNDSANSFDLPPVNDIPNLKELEMATFETTKKLIQQRSMFVGLSLFFVGMAIAFRVNSSGIEWFWADTPQIAVVLFAAAAFMFVRLALVTRKLSSGDI